MHTIEENETPTWVDDKDDNSSPHSISPPSAATAFCKLERINPHVTHELSETHSFV
jgi:hypothetical protein